MHGDIGISLKTILAIIIGLLIAVIAFIILYETGVLGSKMISQTGDVELLSNSPYVSTVDPTMCNGETCNYYIQMKGLSMRAKKQPVDFVLTAEYKGKTLMIPCPVSPLPSGVCRITSDGMTSDLALTFSGSMWNMPPTLIANDSVSYSRILVDGQTVVVGNFSVSFSYMNMPTALLSDRARYLITCADDTSSFSTYAGEQTRYTMCEGEILIKTLSIHSGPKKGCVEILTDGGKNFTEYDTVTIALWNPDLLFCANTEIVPAGTMPQLASPVELTEDKVADCFRDLTAAWEFRVPLAKWNPATWQQPTC